MRLWSEWNVKKMKQIAFFFYFNIIYYFQCLITKYTVIQNSFIIEIPAAKNNLVIANLKLSNPYFPFSTETIVLITYLHSEKYLRNDTIKLQQKGKGIGTTGLSNGAYRLKKKKKSLNTNMTKLELIFFPKSGLIPTSLRETCFLIPLQDRHT